MASAATLNLLSEFLKNCRARLAPGDVGLPTAGSRRSPGLKREEVAILAGVSLSWYTWFEQGRQVTLSTRTLERISTALRLSAEEREYLFALAQHRSPPATEPEPASLNPAVRRMLLKLSMPALIINNRWDVIDWNRIFTRVFGDYGAMPLERRNVLGVLFSEPEFRSDPAGFEAMCRRVVAKLHVDYSRAGDDPAFEALVEELGRTSETFSRHWRTQAVDTRSIGMHGIVHPDFGRMRFEHTSYAVEGEMLFRLLIYAPHDRETEKKLWAIEDELRRSAGGRVAAGKG